MKRPILTILILGSLAVVLSFMMHYFDKRQHQALLLETQQPYSAITTPETGNPIVEIHTQKNP